MVLHLRATHGGNKDSAGNTYLQDIVQGYEGMDGERVEELIASGVADVNCTNSLGQTAAHLAVSSIVSWGANNAVIALLRAKANVNARDNQGRTPLKGRTPLDVLTSFKL